MLETYGITWIMGAAWGLNQSKFFISEWSIRIRGGQILMLRGENRGYSRAQSESNLRAAENNCRNIEADKGKICRMVIS
jgi:hypothetical protein